jgi:hypothetical protein
MPRKFRNTRRENRLEELGRVDAEKAHTSKGKRNLREEKDRIRSELKSGGPAGAKRSGREQMRPRIDPKTKRPYRKAGPSAKEPQVPKSLRERLKELQKKGKQSPGRPGGSGSKPDKRWDKGDKVMTPLRKGGKAKGPNRPRPTGPHMWVRGDKRKKYASGGAVMAGKKVGCQIK